MCSFSPKFANKISILTSLETMKLKSAMTCTSKNIIYCITCTKKNGSCKTAPQYIGETGRRICDRFNEHKASIKENATKVIGQHFSSTGHVTSDMQIIPIECIKSSDPWIRIAREKFYIRKFNAALNKKF